MKFPKRFLPFLLICLLLLTLCGCGEIEQAIADTVGEAVGQALNDALNGTELGDVLDTGIFGETAGAITEVTETAPPEDSPEPTAEPTPEPLPEPILAEDGRYTSKEDVCEYLKLYRKLPGNFMTKNEAKKEYGWEGGGLPEHHCIGGDTFGNREELLPTGYRYQECDIDTMDAKSRGAKRIVFTITESEIHIYYTEDHYESFTLLYEEVT